MFVSGPPVGIGAKDCLRSAGTDYWFADKNYFTATPTKSKRIGSGVAILVIYWILFVMVTSSFFRMLWTIYRTPGFIERSSRKSEQNGRPSTIVPERLSLPSPTLEDILSKDVFVCQPDGIPRWCSTCKIWRPDRSRHCREKDRCVLKLDHFCPWVGGIVSENSMKYFILFNSYTFIYTIFDWILAAVLISQRDPQSALDGNLVAMLIFGLFFMGLTGGIGLSAILNALTNHTTVENTTEPSGNTWTLAIRVAEGQIPAAHVHTITFPNTDAEDPATLHRLVKNEKCSPSATPSTDDNASCIEHGRTFAIVTSDVFFNPWNCGKLENWCQVMGYSILGWFVPMQVGDPWFSQKAYTSRGDIENRAAARPSFFPTGVDVQAMKARAGLADLSPEESKDYETRLENRRNFPYLLGGAGAPRVNFSVLWSMVEISGLTFSFLVETMGFFSCGQTTPENVISEIPVGGIKTPAMFIIHVSTCPIHSTQINHIASRGAVC